MESFYCGIERFENLLMQSKILLWKYAEKKVKIQKIRVK